MRLTSWGRDEHDFKTAFVERLCDRLCDLASGAMLGCGRY